MNTNIDCPVAHCSPEIAEWLDPTGGLRHAGLMVADVIEAKLKKLDQKESSEKARSKRVF